MIYTLESVHIFEIPSMNCSLFKVMHDKGVVASDVGRHTAHVWRTANLLSISHLAIGDAQYFRINNKNKSPVF